MADEININQNMVEVATTYQDDHILINQNMLEIAYIVNELELGPEVQLM